MNPYADGKLRSHGDAIIRAIVVGSAVAVAWNAPYAWYWRLAIFVAIMFVVGIIYPTVQFALAKRKHRRLIEAEQANQPGISAYQAVLKHYPDLAADAEATKEFRATMNTVSEAHRNDTN